MASAISNNCPLTTTVQLTAGSPANIVKKLPEALQRAHLNFLSSRDMVNVKRTCKSFERFEPFVHNLNLSESNIDDANLASIIAKYSAANKKIGSIDLSLCEKITNASLPLLTTITGLKKLNLEKTKITDAGLAHLNTLAQLTHLNLSRTQIMDIGLNHLSTLSALTVLDLGLTKITDAGLAHVSNFSALTHLTLWGTEITDIGLAQISNASFG